MQTTLQKVYRGANYLVEVMLFVSIFPPRRLRCLRKAECGKRDSTDGWMTDRLR
jgi:hypothetical protein